MTYSSFALSWSLALLSVLPMSAASISFTLDSSLLEGQPGTAVTFSGTVGNTGAANVFLNGDNFTFPLPLDDSKFLVNFPPVLAPSQTAAGELFDVLIPSNAALGLYVGTFQILGGDVPAATDILASETIAVNVVPEPSAWLLLFSGIATLAVRKKFCGLRAPALPDR